MHFHFRQLSQNIGHVFQVRPVQLDVGAGGEMSVAFIIVPGYACQTAELLGAKHAVRDTDTEHGCETLNIKPVLQSKWKEFLFRQLTSKGALGLVTELGNTLCGYLPVVLIINVHSGTSCLLHQKS